MEINSSIFIQDLCRKNIMLKTTQRRNQLTYFCMYVSPFGVRRDRMQDKTKWNYKKIGQKSGKLINETDTKFCLLYNSICKN